MDSTDSHLLRFCYFSKNLDIKLNKECHFSFAEVDHLILNGLQH
jgi:hypothetical protein